MESHTNMLSCRKLTIAVSVVVALGLSVMVPPASGHDRYSPGCVQCHGDFEGPVSPKGTIFPSDDKHRMHRSSSYMNTDCALCHVQNGDNPFTYTSAGTAMTTGLGCSGCHEGPGLRRHHVLNGVNCNTTCHQNDPTPSPENVPPPYYGTFDTNVWDPCNEAPLYNENWSIGDTVGQDNDGDNLYDELDPDCSGGCAGDTNGDGIVNVNDLNSVILDWGTDGSANGGDLTGPLPGSPPDGIVNVNDLNAVIVNWGLCP